MLEKLLELLAALAVGISAAFGLTTASENVAKHVPETTSLERAAQHAPDSTAVEAAADGIATAAEALAQAMENAPEQADAGLQRALDAVTADHGQADPPEPPVDAPPAEPPGRP